MPAFIGRNRELNLIDTSLAEARAGAGNCVIVSGDAGIGKSRLISEVRRRAARQGFLILEGACHEQDRSVVFAPLVGMVRSYYSALSPKTMADQLWLLAPVLSRLFHELASAVSETQPALSNEPSVAQGQIFDALASWIVQRASNQPLLLTIEDVHWGDDASQKFLTQLLALIGQHPVLLLISYRTPLPDSGLDAFLALFANHAYTCSLHLRPLKRPEVEAVMRALSNSQQPIRFYFLETVFALTGGNPLFVEELCMSLTATEAVSLETDLLSLHPLPQARIPRSIRRIITQRLQRVSRQAGNLADLCAVSGREFDFELMQALLACTKGRLLQLIGELVDAGLVQQQPGGHFVFRHALTRESLYDRLLIRERRALHGQVAAAIEQVYADAVQHHFGDLSYHSYKAGCWSAALSYARLAGEQALALHAPRAAVEQFTRAIEAVSRLPHVPSWELHCQRAKALETLGDLDSALTDLAMALDNARIVGDLQAEWTVIEALTLMRGDDDVFPESRVLYGGNREALDPGFEEKV